MLSVGFVSPDMSVGFVSPDMPLPGSLTTTSKGSETQVAT
jgi:hypothetical protein